MDNSLGQGSRKGGSQFNAETVEQLLASKQVDHKMQGLEGLYSSAEAVHYFPHLLTAAKYPIRSVHELAFKTVLKWLPRKEPEPDVDPQVFELILFKIIPWINEASAKLNQSMSMTVDDPSQNLGQVEDLKNQALSCLDFLFMALARDVLNQVLLSGLKYANFKVQVAACQAIKRFYLNSHADKTALEVDSVSAALTTNLAEGTRELKRQCLECFSAMCSVFGDDMEPFLDQISSGEALETIKQGINKIGVFESTTTSPVIGTRKREGEGTPKTQTNSKALNNSKGQVGTSSTITSPGPMTFTKQIPQTMTTPVKSATNLGAQQTTPQPSSFLKTGQAATLAVSSQQNLGGKNPPSPRLVQSTLHFSPTTASRYNFDEFRGEEGSDLLLAYDDKWCKRMQIMKKEEPILEELAILQQMIESKSRLLYFSEVNKGLLSVLKNLLMSPVYKKAAAATVPILRSLFKATTRNLHDGFIIFFPELIEKLKSKSKQDDITIDALIFLSSNTNLPNFLKRILKEFSDKNSTLRMNLIDVVCLVLQCKSNYDAAETMKAGPVLADLKKFAETDLSKDLAIPVRKSSERIIGVINELYADEIAAAQNSMPQEPLIQELTQPAKRVAGQSTGRKSSTALPDPTSTLKPKPISSTAEKPIPLMRNQSHITPSMVAEANANPPLISSRSSLALKSTQEQNTRSGLQSIMQPKGAARDTRTSGLAGPLKSSGHNILVAHHPGGGASQGGSRRDMCIYEINPNYAFEAAMEVIEKYTLDKRDQSAKTRLGEVFEMLASKLTSEDDFDRLCMQLNKYRDEISPESLVVVALTSYSMCKYYPPSLLRNFLPQFLSILEHTPLKVPPKSLTKNAGSFSKVEPNSDKAIMKLIDSLVLHYGPVSFFDVFEETLYTKDLFQGKEAEQLFVLFEILLVKIPPEYHPINLILSLIRGFIYLNNSQYVALGLGELSSMCLIIYGKDNYRYIKKEFEMAGLREKEIDISAWPKLTGYTVTESLSKVAKASFKEKIISEVKDQSTHVRSLLSGTQGQRSDPLVLKELLQTCTRHFIYTLAEKENLKLMDFLTEKLVDANHNIVKMAVQILALHFNSAKTTFKFTPVFYANFSVTFKHANPEIRGLALNSAFYIAKQDAKIFKQLCVELNEGTDEVKADILGVILKIMHTDKKFITGFDLALQFDVICEMLQAKKTREDAERLIKLLATAFDRKDFYALISKQKPLVRKVSTEIFDCIFEGKKASTAPAQEENTTSVSKPTPGKTTLASQTLQSSQPPVPQHSKPLIEEKNFIIQNTNSFNENIVKCRTVEEIKRFVGKHMTQELCQLIFDVNSKNVIIGLHQLMEGLILNPLLASKAFVFIFKLLNLLIEAEGKQNDVSKAMADILATMIKLRKSTHEPLRKHEKWALCDFLLVLNKTQFEKKFLAAGSKLAIGLLQTAEEKTQFATLVERNDRKFYMMYMGGIPIAAAHDNSLFVRNSEIAIEDYEPEYDLTSPKAGFIDPQKDKKFLDLQAAMADESSIKYEGEEPFINEANDSPAFMIPSPARTDKKYKREISKGLMSSGSSEGKNRDDGSRESDKRGSPAFLSRDGDKKVKIEDGGQNSPKFGSQINITNTPSFPVANQINSPDRMISPASELLKGKEVKGNFMIFPRSTSKPEMMGSPRNAPAISEGGGYSKKPIQGLIKNSSSKGFETLTKKTSAGNSDVREGQHKSDDNIFKQVHGGKSLTNDSRQDGQSKSSLDFNIQLLVESPQLKSPLQSKLVLCSQKVSTLQ